MRALDGLVLLAACAAACTPAPRRETHWVTTDGAPADRAALGAAAKTCEGQVGIRTRPGAFKGSAQWGVAMLDCLREAGYVPMYQDPNETSPADAPAP